MLSHSLVKGDNEVSDILLNLGTELLGIFFTVSIVEMILERRSHREIAEGIGWRFLQEIDLAVWIWLGGSRDFDLDRLANQLATVSHRDQPTAFTQNLLLKIASKAETVLRTEGRTLRAGHYLVLGLQELARLINLRDERGHITHPETIATHLRSAIQQLRTLVDSETHSGYIEKRRHRTYDSSERMQRHRYYGLRLAGETGEINEESVENDPESADFDRATR